MANLQRTAKSGNAWTENEIKAYNIQIVPQDAPAFFERPDTPQPLLPAEFFSISSDPAPTADPTAYRLLFYMKLAMHPAPMEESAVGDFVVRLLEALGYTPRGKHLRTKQDVPLLICGEKRRTRTDVCVLNAQGISMLVQEDKRHLGIDTAEAQLVAEAIATFNAHNHTRRDLGLDPLTSKMIPGITMRGTVPVFYKIPVTTELATCVGGGAFPDTPTVVHMHVPSVAKPEQLWSEGMEPLLNRWMIMYCFEAFKRFVN